MPGPWPCHAQRLGLMARRMTYRAEGWVRYRFRKGAFAEISGLRCVRLSGASPRCVVVHLHGMGDTVWRAFSDGLSMLHEDLRADLVIPDFGLAPWDDVEVIARTAALIRNVERTAGQLPVYLSGTSMGGCMAFALASQESVQSAISGVIAFSATPRLDLLGAVTASSEVRAALSGRGRRAPPGKRVELDRAQRPLPWFIAYTPGDPVVPPLGLQDAARVLIDRGAAAMLYPLRRPAGHFRPIEEDWIQAFSWMTSGLDARRQPREDTGR